MLSFEQAPPLSATFRFFLTAPWFGVAAGMLLAWTGPSALASRWTPAAAAMTHLLTAGLLLQAMAGALLQLIPVVVGAKLWRPGVIATAVHALCAAGACLLVACLATGSTAWLPLAQGLLGLGLGIFIGAAALALARGPAGPARNALATAVAGLSVAVAAGLMAAEVLRGTSSLPFERLVDLHAGFGLGAWAFVLLAGVSFTVVPMFQRTAPYPAWMERWLPIALAACLAARALSGGGRLGQAALWAALAVAMTFTLATLWLQGHRRRARADATVRFFRIAMSSLLLACALVMARIAEAPDMVDPRWEVMAGILALAGGFTSAVHGMLYRIVPFIAWLKLPPRRGLGMPQVTVDSIIDEPPMQGQLRLHFAALVLLALAPWWPGCARTAGALFAASCAWLGWNLLGGLRRYLVIRQRVLVASAQARPEPAS